jgi:5-methylcytosine-specific restriction endonuclease McrA
MDKCSKCDSYHIKTDTSYKYHDIFTCLTCGYWTFSKSDSCCRNPIMIISQDNKFPSQPKLYKQCIICGGCLNRKKQLSLKLHSQNCEREFSNSEFEDWCNARNAENKMLYESFKTNSSYNKYKQYLESNEWKDKRKLILQRDNNLCQLCKEKQAEAIHHLTYDNLYNEPLEDLLSLCKSCHLTLHERLSQKEKDLLNIKLSQSKR